MEDQFWKHLISLCLRPKMPALGKKDDLDKELKQLRNKVIMAVAVANIMWIVVIATLDKHKDLQVSDVIDDVIENRAMLVARCDAAQSAPFREVFFKPGVTDVTLSRLLLVRLDWL